MDMQGNYLENRTLQPDILVYNEPEGFEGEDAQLESGGGPLAEEVAAKK